MIEFQHPTLLQYGDEWLRYRSAYEGGRAFIDRYLKKYSVRETDATYQERKDVTYCPAFASAAITEVNNTIFSRMPDVTRLTGSDSYKKAIQGHVYGVDYIGTSIDNFIGCEVLPELTVMGRVGVYVDMPVGTPAVGRSDEIHPYYYIYQAEDIVSWITGKPGSGHEFTQLLLRDNFYQTNGQYGLVTDIDDQYRLLEVVPEGVQVTFLSENEQIIDQKLLNLRKIPFVLLKLKHSLMRNVADYQIALLNIESTDVDYARKANFPIYTEQASWISALPGQKPDGQDDEDNDEPQSGTHQREVGTQHGVRYPKGNERPGFIHPSSDPVKANMEKEEQMKRDIRLLVHLNVSNLSAKAQSLESKDFDREGLENGLSMIALVLEEAERKLATFWSQYESNTQQVQVAYPRNFDLRTDEDRRVESEKQIALSKQISSDTFQREVLKCAVTTLMGTKVSSEVLARMHKEIDTAPSLTANPKDVLADFEAGLVSSATASKVRGYKDDEVEKAQEEKAKRMAAVAASQGGIVGAARGTPDFQTDDKATAADEKVDKTKRGEAKLDG